MKINRGLLLVLMAVFVMSCKTEQKKPAEGMEIISIENLEKTKKPIQLIDVRTPEEYSEGYILNAKNINFKDDNFMELMLALDKNKPVYVYCMVGGRSGKAATKLKDAGFKIVYDYKGGYKEWKEKGKAITMNQ